uniref:Putative plastid protein 36 n=1 Tax=Chroomonas placoidea TaxID=173977 RepID=A0A222AIB1_9CRYP|nr:putative plastid protein 36 [Chroomonas placoidea]ASO76098.1 putative plastid protein 36 [Chroomonas placoidea]
MKKFIIECPVPKDQQPINEYSNLKTSIFFLWTTKDLNTYIKGTIFLVTCSYLLVLALVISSTPQIEKIQPVEVINYINVFGNLLLNLYFIRLYLGWTYIYERLIKASISYEESGWYDGQVWVKTPNVLIQDKLVAEYQIAPVLNRLKLTITGLTLLVTLGVIHLCLQ